MLQIAGVGFVLLFIHGVVCGIWDGDQNPLWRGLATPVLVGLVVTVVGAVLMGVFFTAYLGSWVLTGYPGPFME